MDFKDYYAILGVSRTASTKEITSAYRRLAKQHHPDVNKSDPKSAERFKDISEAYTVLSDAEKRRRYDALGADGGARAPFGAEGFRTPHTGGGGASGFSDFFEAIFGGGMSFESMFEDAVGHTTPARVEYDVPVTLSEVQTGTTRSLTLPPTRCPTCHGTGEIATQNRSGRRRVAVTRGVCSACGGRGATGEQRTIDVKIPAGVSDGARLTVRPRGARSGDIVLVVRYTPHPVFTVDGRHVRVTVPVYDHEAALGAVIEVPLLRGSVRLTIPGGSTSDQILRVKGHGLPGRGGEAPGDVLVRLRIVQPPRLSTDERAAYEDLRTARERAHASDPRSDLARAVREAG